MSLSPPRENTLGRVVHPDLMRGPDGSELHLIEDHLTRRITDGDPTFGWEGDERYALYVNYRLARWELWRLESDGVYRVSVAVPGNVNGPDAVAWLVKWIVDHDGRRGFDAAEFVIKESIRTQVERERRAHAFHEEAADRLEFGLMKDIGATEGSGVTKRLHPVPAAPIPAVPPVSTKEIV